MLLNLKKTSTKSQQVACAIEKEILSSKLKTGSRLAGMRDIAKYFSVSLKVVQCAIEILEAKGLVKSRLGSGTFITCNSEESNILQKNQVNTIYVFMHSPENIISSKHGFFVENQIIYGGYSSGTEYFIQPLPVSQQKQKNLTDIAWNIISKIPDKSKVFISSLWFKELFPFLHEKRADVICLIDQYEQIKFPDAVKYIEKSGWNIFTLDYATGISDAVKYFYYKGDKRIGLVKLGQDQYSHPFLLGMTAAFKECGLKYEEELYLEINYRTSDIQMKYEIISFCKKQKLGSLIIANDRHHKFPEDVITSSLNQLGAIASISLMAETEIINCPVIDFSWKEIGKMAVLFFKDKESSSGDKLFKPEFITGKSI